jgi:hypothetical protein
MCRFTYFGIWITVASLLLRNDAAANPPPERNQK